MSEPDPSTLRRLRLKVVDGYPLDCADLAALGIEGVQDHNPHLQGIADDFHCHCWVEPPAALLSRTAGAFYAPAEYEGQPCDDIQRWTTPSGVRLEACCRCAESIEWTEVEAAVDAALAGEATGPWPAEVAR